MMKAIRLSLVCLAILGTVAAYAATKKTFDYYMLSLSWSPQFCASHPKDSQCSRFYGIVLHGLWPQYNKGYPQSCTKEKISTSLIRSFPGLYPSEKLAVHEWQKHGTCSGLTPKGYLQLSKKLKDKVIAPDELQNLTKPLRVTSSQLNQMILTANPYLKQDAIAFSCADGGRFLQEIYVCFDKKGVAAQACGADVQRRSRLTCGRPDFLIRSIR